jgi:hypothetical protein
MPKNLFQDMVKVKNSRKEIPKKEIFRKEIPKKEIPKYRSVDEFRQPGGTKTHFGLWFVAAVCIVVFIFALSFLFGKAEVAVNPKIKDVTLNENLSAVKDFNMSGLSFDLVIISGEETKKVAAGEEKEVAFSSKGAVFIYNTFSAAPQKLSINTQLEGSNGKIYKTATETIVPGVNIDGTPGKVEVGIYAAGAGEEYNSSPLDFKIFGFKGTPRYDKFYARSIGAITGGFKGRSGVISDIDKDNTFAELRTALKDKLFKKATEQIPGGFVLFKDAVFLNIDEENVEFAGGDGSLPLKTKGTLYGFLFDEKELAKKIARDNIPNYDDTEIYIPNIKDLTFSLSDKDVSFSDVQNISFNISGNAKLVWRFDDTAFSEALLGKPKADFNQILAEYPNVDSAQLSLSPFWIRSFPGKLKDIKIIVNYPQ